LIGQFLLESFIVVSISVFFAVLLYIFTRPVFGEIVGREIPSLLAFPLYFLSFPILLILGVGLLAGGYPALLLSAVNPIATLKGKAGGVRENIFIRRLLVGFQFSTATMVFIAATIITTQVSYFLNSDLGFGKDQLISVFLPRDWSAEGVRHMEVIRNEMAQIPGVTHASISYAMPNRNSINSTNIYKPGEDSSHAVSSSVLVSDENYAGTFQIPLRAGIFFNHPAGDSEYTSIVLNETAVKELGWASAQEALGQSLKLSGGEDLYTVAGVVKDYHFESKRNIIKPLVFFHVRNWHAYRFLTFKISAANLPQTMNAVQDKWTSLMPSTPFDYSFMDETIENAYQSELQLKKASYAATLLAVFIVLLGILGIVSLSIGKKTREVGIRKVLGASGSSIVGIFLKEFIMILTLGNLVAWPVVYLCMHTWLDTFAYRVTIGLSPFVGVGLCLTLFTVFIISVQTLKTAGLNPAGALRSE
jgi:putative ABC transport system permease protein